MKTTTIAVLTAFIMIASGTQAGAGTSAHGDHSAKHGGQFFMAPDGFHHLEGVLIKGRELRIYFYDAKTHPKSAAAFLKGAKAEVQGFEFPFKPGPKSAYLSAFTPQKARLPFEFSVWIQFPSQNEPDLFNFTFEK